MMAASPGLAEGDVRSEDSRSGSGDPAASGEHAELLAQALSDRYGEITSSLRTWVDICYLFAPQLGPTHAPMAAMFRECARENHAVAESDNDPTDYSLVYNWLADRFEDTEPIDDGATALGPNETAAVTKILSDIYTAIRAAGSSVPQWRLAYQRQSDGQAAAANARVASGDGDAAAAEEASSAGNFPAWRTLSSAANPLGIPRELVPQRPPRTVRRAKGRGPSASPGSCASGHGATGGPLHRVAQGSSTATSTVEAAAGSVTTRRYRSRTRPKQQQVVANPQAEALSREEEDP